MSDETIIQATTDTLPALERLSVLAAEIRVLTRMTVENAIAIGQRLNEAKEMVPGSWGEWLQENVRYSQDTAERFMNVANACANSATLRNSGLGVSALCELLALPSTEAREAYVTESHVVNGVEKQADEMSVRELRSDIARQKELTEQAIKDKEAAQAQARKTKDEYEAEKKKASDAAAKVKELKEQLKAAKEAPTVPVAGDGDNTATDKIKQEAREAAARELQEKIADAEKKAKEAEDKAEDLKRQLAVADPVLAKFGTLYVEAQEMLGKLIGLIKTAAPDKQGGMRKALTAALEKYNELAREVA